MKLLDLAHSRTGDKGNISCISVTAYDTADYARLEKAITARRLKDWFAPTVSGDLIRYEIPSLGPFNFVLFGALGGGVTRSPSLDMHGKNLSSFLLDMEVELEPSQVHWGGPTLVLNVTISSAKCCN